MPTVPGNPPKSSDRHSPPPHDAAPPAADTACRPDSAPSRSPDRSAAAAAAAHRHGSAYPDWACCRSSSGAGPRPAPETHRSCRCAPPRCRRGPQSSPSHRPSARPAGNGSDPAARAHRHPTCPRPAPAASSHGRACPETPPHRMAPCAASTCPWPDRDWPAAPAPPPHTTARPDPPAEWAIRSPERHCGSAPDASASNHAETVRAACRAATAPRQH